MSLRLILIAIGALIIAAILIDGYRHWRKAKKYQENLDKRPEAKVINPEPKLGKKTVDYIDELDFTPRIRLDEDISEVRIKPIPLIQDEPHLKPKPVMRTATQNTYAPKVPPSTMTVPEPLPKKDKFIILHVLAEKDTYLSGEGLQTKFNLHGLHHGPMNIYHQYENDDTSGQILFSVANAFEPGTLNLADPEGFYTQGLTLFMQLPHRSDPEEAFEAMLNTATVLAKAFNARLCDHQRQPLTAAMVDEYRNDVSACNVI